MQVEQFLEDSARRDPGKTAVVCGEHRLTYREIDQRCNRLAHALSAAGVRHGDRVAIFLEDSAETVVSIFAALKAGCVFMVVNSTTKTDKLTFILNDSRAAAIVTDVQRDRVVAETGRSTPHLRVVVIAGGPSSLEIRGGKDLFAFEQLTAQTTDDATKPDGSSIDLDLAALIYTSGSTGTPKGVMLTHLNIVSAATSITTYLENTSEDVLFNVLPLSFDYGLYQVLMAFKFGGTIVLGGSFAYPHVVLEKIVAEGVTGLPIVPMMSAILLQMDLRQYDLTQLRYISSTADVLPTNHIVELRTRLPHVKIYSMYGLTECKRVSYLSPDEIDIRPMSVGKAMPNQEAYIVDEGGRRLSSGVGELVVRGSSVMKGYWEMPEETARVLKPGPVPGERVLYSGDLFRMDEDGYLFFLGRKDDIIKTRGERVSPREVEDVLNEMPGIAGAAVFGVPDAVLGQAVKAVVTVGNGTKLSERDVLAHCVQRLESHMLPSIVEFRESFPTTTSGKIDRKGLTVTVVD